MTAATRRQLMDAAVRLTARSGVRGLTARAIGAEAGANQALIFYHFDGVDGLLRAAYADATRAMVEDFATGLASATTFTELYEVGERLGRRSREDGSAALLLTVMAAAHHDEQMAASLVTSLGAWLEVVEAAVSRVLATSGLDDVVDAAALSRTLSAATIGMVTIDALPGAPLGATLRAADGVPQAVDGMVGRFPRAVVRRLARVLGRADATTQRRASSPPTGA
ncbi:MAG: TetR/AcrR family transcriptional regulator [Dermatophilaceae bacterium]